MSLPLKKPIRETVPKSDQESFHCEVVRGTSYGAQWHFHPEYQITLALKGRGHRVVGDSLAPLVAGDLVLVGSNLPHVWHQDQGKASSKDTVHAIVIRFLSDFLGDEFLHSPEMDSIRRLLKQSARGLHVRGATCMEATARIKRLAESKGFSRVIELLALLDLLSHSKDLKPLSSPNFAPELKGGDQDRMERVLHYIHSHLTEPIDRDEVATRASLSPGAFSRFFKTRTGKSLPQYVNELRIGRACSILAEGDAKVSDIALDSGFENLANFNRQFRSITGMMPRQYREEFQHSANG